MKKLVLCAAAFCLAGCLFACGVQQAAIVMVTGGGVIEDKAFSQDTWEGVRMYAGLKGKTCYYYQPSAEKDDAYLECIRRAVIGGAEVILLPGHYFDNAVITAQESYPDTSFILLGGTPSGEVAANTVAVTFAEEQAGYLAGYAAVTEGYRSLGFLGSTPSPDIVGFGVGFAQGANAAAARLGETVHLRYAYTGGIKPGPDVKEGAVRWYADKIEVIFACGGAMCESVFEAAAEEGGKTIGVDIDQGGGRGTMIFSVVKRMGVAAGQILEQFYADAFPGGETIMMGAAEGAVGISMESSQLKNFTQEEYLSLYAELVLGEINVLRTAADGLQPISPADLGIELSSLTIEYEE